MITFLLQLREAIRVLVNIDDALLMLTTPPTKLPAMLP